MKQATTTKTVTKIIPFSLTVFIIIADQLSKILISQKLVLGERIRIIGNFLWFWHVRNKGMAFSLGSGFPDQVRNIIFIGLPLIVLLVLIVYYFRSRELNRIQRWCFAAIVGGGLGNLIDRIFRIEGVVDFISFKFYGIFGLSRYPTFNVADSSIVIAGIILILSILFQETRKRS